METKINISHSVNKSYLDAILFVFELSTTSTRIILMNQQHNEEIYKKKYVLKQKLEKSD